MATTFSAATVAVPSFTGPKAETPRVLACIKPCNTKQTPAFCVKASLKNIGLAAATASASLVLLTGNAMAFDVLLGSSDGGLKFVPEQFSVPAGEKINFINNAGFPHNVVFDEDAIPAGVDAVKISMPEEDLLNGPKEVYSVTLDTKGEYSFYCSPHAGAGMVGKVTVN